MSPHRSKKLQANGLWESSRMMLPEHVEAYNDHHKQMLKQSKPELDEQKLTEMASLIQEAYCQQAPIQLILFAEFAEQSRSLSGVITAVYPQRNSLKIRHHQTDTIVDYASILEVIYDPVDL